MNEVASESLQIVGEELAVTIGDARLALEQFAEGEGGPQVLDRCMRLLHTVRGVLRMTETYGASLLAEEMEATCAHLARSRDDAREEAVEALSRAAVQLPAYVERILRGGRDIPLVLLPLLNDLRAARGKPLLSESTLLLLNVFAPAESEAEAPQRQPSGEDLNSLCRELRPRFQLALLGWIRGTDIERNLGHMGEIAERLEQASTNTEVHRLWWIVAGVTEALLNKSLDGSVSLKRLMGHADRELKRLISVGEARYAEQAPRELINNLLYYIARVEKPTPRVSAIRDAFRLAELVPAASQVEAVRESLAAPSAHLMHTVAEAIREDLARVKDVLDIFVRTGMQHVEELAPQVELLKKIADTLGVLGLGELREIVNARREELETLTAQRGEPEESRFVEMAAALLSVEHRLNRQLLGLIAPQKPDAVEAPADDAAEAADLAEVSRAVMRECVVNLARVKEAVTQVIEKPEEGAALDAVPAHLRGITAGLLILDKPKAVEVVEEIGAGISELVQQGYGAGDRQRIDLLADSIVSLDYYLETLEAGRREPVYMLDNARRCLAAMRDLAGTSVPDVARSLGGSETTLDLSEPSATLQALDPERLQPAVPAARPESQQKPAPVDHGEERADPEIIELFIEEAGEELEAINRNLPAWLDNHGNEEALVALRRSFHTLKGSGRMVGAKLLGDFAWSIENLLNRVINKTLEPNQTIFGLLGEAVDALPQLLEQLEAGAPVTADVDAIMATASALAEGRAPAGEAEAPEAAAGADEEPIVRTQIIERDESLDQAAAEEPSIVQTQVIERDESLEEAAGDLSPAFQAEGVEAEGVEADDALEATARAIEPTGEEEPGEAGIDPVLLDILTKEFDTHIAAIREFIAECRQGIAPFAVPENLYRACHTLHGSATMAKADVAVALTSPLNRLVRRAYEHSVPLDLAAVDAIGDTAGLLESVLSAFGSDAPWPDTDEQQARLAELDASVQAAAVAAEANEEEEDTGDEAPVAESTVESPAPDEEFEAEAMPFDAEIAGIFADEAAEILEGLDAALLRLGAGEPETDVLDEIQRYLHTLKGGARMAGLASMGNLSHVLEAILIGVISGRLHLDEALRGLLQQSVDELHRMRDQVVGGVQPVMPDDLKAWLRAALAGDAVPDMTVAIPSPFISADEQEGPSADVGEEAPAAEEMSPADEVPPDEPQIVEGIPEETVQAVAGDAPFATADEHAEAAEGALGDLESPVADEVAGEEAEETAAEFVEPEPEEDESGTGLDEPEAVEPAAEAPPLDAELTESEASQPEPETEAGIEAGAEEAPETEAEPESEADIEAGAEEAPEVPEPLAAGPAKAALHQIGELARELAAPARPTAPAKSAPAQPPVREAPDRRQFARVDPRTLEQLLNNAGEISIFHSRLAQQMGQIQFNLEELGQTVVRLKDQLRSLELATEAQILYLHQSEIARNDNFDPLELDRYSRIQQLSRALAETASDVNSLKDLLQNLTGDTEAMLSQQSRTAAELQDGLMRTRMVPFQEHAARLARLVRQTASEHGRRADLTLHGGGELDRQVLEKMLAPFEHMLRNAVIHGIEDPGEREAAGKPPAGTVSISLSREGAEVVIKVADDGRGLDVEAIRRKAMEQGLLDPEAEVTDEEAMQFILRPGFSTAEKLTQSAGRGIGMDVVASEITKLGGTLRLESEAGRGTTFVVRLPFTLAVTQALIVRAGQELYALPLPTVEGIIRISRSDFDARMNSDDPCIEYAGQIYRFRHLGQFVGTGPSRLPADDERVPLILVRAGENSTALITDEMMDSREIVVKSVGDQLATIRGIAGATILGDGRVVMILDAGGLVRTARQTVEPEEPEAPEVSAQPLALVVDDSITMRRVTQRLLERNDFQVLTAKDGVEAVGVLKDHRPDIILLDVEMPRMDGYEFAKHVRNNEDTAELPIVMITSRVSEKHRARAIEIGVNDYLGKPYQEQELLDAVSRLLSPQE